MKRRTAALSLIAMLAAGCAGLPPKIQPVKLTNAAPLAGLDSGGGEWPAKEWWNQYQDPTLNRVIELALGNSPTLATARSRFESALQSVRVAGAASGAQVVAGAAFDRQRLSDNGLLSPQLLGFHWYNQADLGLHASYAFDWWGKQRDAVSAALDQAHAAAADRSAAALVLASSVADAYFGWQADQSRLVLAREREGTVLRESAITAARVGADLDSGDSVNRSQMALGLVREQIAGLEGSAKLRLVALAALAGCSMTELPPITPRPLPAPHGSVPDNVTIDLISRRADITASRWRVEAAEKNLHSARAEFFPDVSVNALLGLQSINVSTLLEYRSRVPQAGAAIHLPIFDAGRLKARYGSMQAAINSAVSAYQEIVVGAARDVATQVSSRAQIAAQRTQREIEVDAAVKLRGAAAARAGQGITDASPELAATETWIVQRDALLQLDAAALSADIALQRALGGGYEGTSTP